MAFIVGAVGVIVAFGLVIFVHEFGHFIVAKKSGVKVERFSFGLGPELFGIQWGETRYCLACIPLGGEVRMTGETEPAEGVPEGAPIDPRGFFSRPWYARIPIVVAGPAMNYLLSFVLFSFIALAWGVPRATTEPVIGELADGFPAAAAGLKSGDRFLSINGAPVTEWKPMAEVIHKSPGRAMVLEVRRGDSTLTVRLTPRNEDGRGLIGVTPAVVQERLKPLAAFAKGAEQCWAWSRMTLTYLAERIARREKPELSGPVGIASVVARAARSGPADYLFLVALISVGIGLFNLFPIPMLDGGHLAFFLWEGVFGRPLGRRWAQAANMAGMAALLAIFVFATLGDIRRLRTPPPDAPSPASHP
jgi:regulator of sigma E protease